MNYVGACASCAVQGISGLCTFRDKPFEAMKTFCKDVLVKDPSKPYFYNPRPEEKYHRVYSHYIFCSGPEGRQEAYEKKYGRNYTCGFYAVPFAAYIRRYKLGRVMGPPAVLNHKFHPETTCQVWVWQPNQKRLERWYERYVAKPEEAAKKAAEKPEPAAPQPVPEVRNA